MNKLLLILLCLPMIGFSQLKVAILDFENTSTVAKYDGLGKAMSNMLITDLKNNIHPRKVVFMERSQLNKILDEQNIQKSKNFDKSTAVNFGKLTGVDFIIIGSIYVLDKHCNITSRMVNVETSEITHSKEVDGSINNWMTLKSNLAQEFAKAVNNPISIEDNASKEQPEGVLIQYSKVIDAIDENNIEKAEDIISMMKDLEVDFDYFDLLKEDIEEIKEKIVELEKSVENLESTSKVIKEDLNNLRDQINKDVSVFVNEPKTAQDFFSNIYYYHNTKNIKKQVDAYEQLFSNFNINFIDVYHDYFLALYKYDFTETFDEDYTQVISKMNETINLSCTDADLKDLLVLYYSFPESKYYSAGYPFQGHFTTDYDNDTTKYLNQKRKIFIYTPFANLAQSNPNHDLLKAYLLFSHYHLGVKWNNWSISDSEWRHGDTTDLFPISSDKWIYSQYLALSDFNLDYKKIDEYYLDKEVSVFFIERLQYYVEEFKNGEFFPHSSKKRIDAYKYINYPSGQLKEKGLLFSEYDSSLSKYGFWETYYENGQLESSIYYYNNKKHGISINYHKNGIIKRKMHYKKGQGTGSYVAYFESGQVSSEGKYVDNTSEDKKGVWKYYYPDGSLKIEADFGGENRYFFKDKRFGLYKSYYENEQLKFEGNYYGDIMVGKWTHWYDNGHINYEIEYADRYGILPSERGYYDKYGPDSLGRSQALRVGEYMYYYNNGNLKTKGQYLEGLKLGVWEFDHNAIKLTDQRHNATTKKIGLWQYWYENLSLKSEYEYEDGEMISKRTWDENGNQTLNWEKK